VSSVSKNEKEIICVLVDSKLKEYLNKEAKAKGMTLSELVREVIIDYVIESETKGGTENRQ
jgi:antitoxin component of RelBE/YafQ-DinJ toxin-antitoxin module